MSSAGTAVSGTAAAGGIGVRGSSATGDSGRFDGKVLRCHDRNYRQLDIRQLRRKGYLQPCGWITLTWSQNGEATGSIGIRAEFDRVVLRYRHQGYDQDWKDEEYPVFTAILFDRPILSHVEPTGRPL
jgi:hypothetical protein